MVIKRTVHLNHEKTLKPKCWFLRNTASGLPCLKMSSIKRGLRVRVICFTIQERLDLEQIYLGARPSCVTLKPSACGGNCRYNWVLYLHNPTDFRLEQALTMYALAVALAPVPILTGLGSFHRFVTKPRAWISVST